MTTIRKFGVLSTAKVLAILMALVGLVNGIVYSFGGFLYELLTGTLNSGTVLAFLALIGMPITFAAVGFVAGAGGAYLYNLAARWGGGLEMDLEQEV